MGAECAPASILSTHTSLPVLESKARKRLSSVAPMKTRPPAVATDPPILGRPVFCLSAGRLSVTPSRLSHAISPVFTLIAKSLPHGGWLQGMLVSGSQKRLLPLALAAVGAVGVLHHLVQAAEVHRVDEQVAEL